MPISSVYTVRRSGGFVHFGSRCVWGDRPDVAHLVDGQTVTMRWEPCKAGWRLLSVG